MERKKVWKIYEAVHECRYLVLDPLDHKFNWCGRQWQSNASLIAHKHACRK